MPRIIRWLFLTGALVGFMAITPSLPFPPVLQAPQLPSWWSRTGPVAGTGSVLRLAVVLAGGGWSVRSLTSGMWRSRHRFPPAAAASAAHWTRMWKRIRATGGLIRLAIGLTSSGAALSACASSGPSSSDSAPAASPVAPVLLDPTTPPSPAVSTVTGPSPRTPARPIPAASTVAAPSPRAAATPTQTHARSAVSVARAGPGPSRKAESHGSAKARPIRPATWTVRPGDDFWSIAEIVVARASSAPAGGRHIALYWSRLIEANRGRLPRPGDPDLLFPGDLVVLPPL
jgi:hypothetical protein